jgi:hypothetical protein
MLASQGSTSEASWIVTAIEDPKVEMGRNWNGFHSWTAPYASRVIVDRSTKVAHFIPVKMTYSGATLAELYMSWIVCLDGVPKKIVSDRESQFTCKF